MTTPSAAQRHREAWLDGFTERLRNVLQKHSRELLTADIGPSNAPRLQREAATDGAIDELGRFVLDAIDAARPEFGTPDLSKSFYAADSREPKP